MSCLAPLTSTHRRSPQVRLTTKFPRLVYWRKGRGKEWQTPDVQGLWLPSNYQEIHDSRYNVFLRAAANGCKVEISQLEMEQVIERLVVD
jgi:hypothetical protein